MRRSGLPKGEKLFNLLASLQRVDFYGTMTVRYEAGKVTHVETNARRMW
jgi:hypothetical protein